VFIAYFKSDCFKYLLINNDNRALIKSLVEIVVLPPYAKFIFSISDTIKNSLTDFIFYYIKNSRQNVEISTIQKFNTFLKAFYINNDISEEKMIKSNYFLILIILIF
jgi:hypothetical protein